MWDYAILCLVMMLHGTAPLTVYILLICKPPCLD